MYDDIREPRVTIIDQDETWEMGYDDLEQGFGNTVTIHRVDLPEALERARSYGYLDHSLRHAEIVVSAEDTVLSGPIVDTSNIVGGIEISFPDD